MGHPRPLFQLFSSFQTNVTILRSNKCEKSPSSMRHWALNSQPLEHESPHITTTLNKLVFLNGPFPASFSLFLSFQNTVDSKQMFNIDINFCQ